MPTGDFVTVPMLHFGVRAARAAANAAFPCANVLQHIKAGLGSFAILGNHDAYSNPALVISALKAHGIPVLKQRPACLWNVEAPGCGWRESTMLSG